jgi:hypothetical protein
MKAFFPIFIACALAITGCGPTLRPPAIPPRLLEQEAALQRELLFKSLIDRKARLQRIYIPLRIANADLCGSNLSPVTGISGIDQQSLPPDLRDTARRLYGLSDGIMIIDIVPGSPAAQAGLQPRDVITGAARGAGVMPSGWTWSALTIPDLVKVIQTSGGDPITLLIRRTGNTFPVLLSPRSGCGYSIELAPGDAFNAYSDGRRIIVLTGLFNHVPDDREIAVIVGHELAHNILRHSEKKEGNKAIGGAAGLVFDIGLLALGINTQGAIAQAGMKAGAKAYSQEFESEADYLGLYMLARAGFDIEVAPDLFRRMGTQDPTSQIKTYFSTHPTTPERAVVMTQTISEIRDKSDRHEALLPKNLEGRALAVSAPTQANATIVAAAQKSGQAPSQPSQPILALVPPGPTVPPSSSSLALSPDRSPVIQPTSSSSAVGIIQPPAGHPATAPTRDSSGSPRFAQIYLVKGRIVSNPPQAFSVEFFADTGKAAVTFGGAQRIAGEFEFFDLADSVSTKRSAQLIKPDTLKPFDGADTKGFATFGEAGFRLECAYALNRTSGRGEGTCADSQENIYQLAF